jgi:hypothetical protein
MKFTLKCASWRYYEPLLNKRRTINYLNQCVSFHAVRQRLGGAGTPLHRSRHPGLAPFQEAKTRGLPVLSCTTALTGLRRPGTLLPIPGFKRKSWRNRITGREGFFQCLVQLIVGDVAPADFAAALALAIRRRAGLAVGVLLGTGLAAISFTVVIENAVWVHLAVAIRAAAT